MVGDWIASMLMTIRKKLRGRTQTALGASLAFEGALTAHKKPQPTNTSESVRVVGPGDRTASADVDLRTGTTVSEIAGPATHGGEGRLETANLLLRKLGELGEDWGDAEAVDDRDVD